MMKIQLAAGVAALALLSNPALAQDRAGKIQVKVMGTAVLPDGKIKNVIVDPGLPSGTQTKANDNYVPTVAIEYFLSDNFSIETICCVTQHDVDASAGALSGAELVSNARVVPATVTAKLHFDLGAVKPYVGAGPTYFLWIQDKPGSATTPAPFNVTSLDLSNELGAAVQAGVDIPLNDSGMGISLDAKRYFISSTASWYAGSTLVIQTKHKLDPWVLSAGLSFLF